MSRDNIQTFLDLLEELNRRGEQGLIVHVFVGSKKIGKMLFSDEGLVYSGGISLELSKHIENHVNANLSNSGALYIFDSSLNDGESSIQLTGELLAPPPHLYVFGAGHVGQAVAAIGALAGYNIIVVDDRVEFLTRDRFPHVNINLVEESYDKIKSRIRISKNGAVVIVTRGHQYDETCLEQVLDTGVKYIGMIGSRRRVLSIFKRLEAAGMSRRVLDQVHAPIGLKIGAVSPQEIAVAIMAEIISVMNGHKLDHTSERRR